MVTYLLSIGYTSLHVGIIRFISTIFELSATWIAPWLMRRIGVVRSAIWSLSWQMIWLAAGAGWFFADIRGQGTGSIAAATGLVVGVAFSRVGLWSYDLCAQSIIQEVRIVPPCPTKIQNTDVMMAGSRRRPPRVVQHCRSCLPEPVRARVVRDYDRLLPAGPVPMARCYQYCGCVRRWWALRELCPAATGSPVSSAGLRLSGERRESRDEWLCLRLEFYTAMRSLVLYYEYRYSQVSNLASTSQDSQPQRQP